MEKYIKLSDIKRALNEIAYSLEEHLINNEDIKAKIGYESGYKEGIKDSIYLIKCDIQKLLKELEDV